MKESVAAAWVFSGLILEPGPRHVLHLVLGKGFWVLLRTSGQRQYYRCEESQEGRDGSMRHGRLTRAGFTLASSGYCNNYGRAQAAGECHVTEVGR